MTSFSSLISSLGDKQKGPSTLPTNGPGPTQPNGKPNGVTDRFKLTPTNAVAGVKRRSEEPEAVPKVKAAKTETNGVASRPAAAPSSRFQLTAKSSPARTASPAGQKSSTASTIANGSGKTATRPLPKASTTNTPTPPGTADGSAKPKKSFASILEKAKAAQAAASASTASGIQHKRVEKLTRRERLKLHEEALAAQKLGKKGRPGDRSRSGTPASHPAAVKNTNPEPAYKGTMKKAAPEPLGYKGTMKPGGTGAAKAPAKKGLPQDKYGGYASWSDLDDAEDEDGEEDGYGYDESDDDMEGGFDDLEAEENAALRAAKREDQEALEEEERLKREKAERKRKLLALSKSAAAKKKF